MTNTWRQAVRSYSLPIAAGLALAMALVAAVARSAAPETTFILEEHDKIVAEAKGCFSECRIIGGARRMCTIREFGCRVVCSSLPECRISGGGTMKACAIVKDGP